MTKESANPTSTSATEDVPHHTTSSATTSSSSSSNHNKSDGHHRFVGWSALLFCSTMALASKVTDTWDEESRGKDDWFVIVVSAVSIGCAFFAIMGYAISRWKFPGSVFEGFFAILAQIAWICGMPVIMDPNRGIAVSKGHSYQLAGQNVILENSGTEISSHAAEFSYIRNANIYFFSWASTIAIVYICGRFARAAVRRSNKLASWTGLWYLAFLASLVVLVDSTKLFVAFDCHDQDEEQQQPAGSALCNGTAYAMGLGSVGTVLSVISSILATCGMLPQCLELILSLLIFGFYMAGVTIITFDDGPGTSIGNLYFATWMGACVTAVLLGRAYFALIQNYLHRHDNKNKHKKDEEQKLPDDDENVATEQPPVVFPDVEMGGNDDNNKAKEDNDDNDGVPTWVKEEPEVHTSASVPPPSATGKKPEEEEEGVEVEAGVASKAKKEVEKVEDKAGEETQATSESKQVKKEDEKAEESSGAAGDDQGNKTETDKGSKEEGN